MLKVAFGFSKKANYTDNNLEIATGNDQQIRRNEDTLNSITKKNFKMKKIIFKSFFSFEITTIEILAHVSV